MHSHTASTSLLPCAVFSDLCSCWSCAIKSLFWFVCTMLLVDNFLQCNLKWAFWNKYRGGKGSSPAKTRPGSPDMTPCSKGARLPHVYFFGSFCCWNYYTVIIRWWAAFLITNRIGCCHKKKRKFWFCLYVNLVACEWLEKWVDVL